MKFRKRPVVIDAVQFLDTPAQIAAISEFAGTQISVFYTVSPPVLQIKTLEGTMTAQVGDWIIRGVNGEFYPCKPDIFVKTYEAVE